MKARSDLVSILIPVYNREKLIAETITSAINQTYTDLEIIVVDNKSTDNTWKILQEFAAKDPRIKIYQNSSNIGPVRNWQNCIKYAQGEYGKILWSDDLISTDFIEKCIPFLQRNKDVGFVFTAIEIFNDHSNEKLFNNINDSSGIYNCEKYINGVLFKKNYPVSPGCALFRLKDLKKSLLIEVPNKVKSDFSKHAIGNDMLIYLLTANLYKEYAYIDSPLSSFRSHEGSITLQSINGQLQLLYNLAAAYFVEEFRPDLVKKLNTRLFISYKKYSTTAKTLMLDKLENYYRLNTNYNIDLIYLAKRTLNKLFGIY